MGAVTLQLSVRQTGLEWYILLSRYQTASLRRDSLSENSKDGQVIALGIGCCGCQTTVFDIQDLQGVEHAIFIWKWATAAQEADKYAMGPTRHQSLLGR